MKRIGAICLMLTVLLGGCAATPAAPSLEERLVTIDGAQNTRDIGGVVTLDGRTVKTRMLVRGTELDGLGDARFCIDEAARDAAMETFGFVCDFDLRAAELDGYVSPLGTEVTHTFFAAPMYEEVFEEDGKAALRRMFTALADEANYPMYLHCTYGADRTGTLVFLLQGVLGVSQEEMLREYRLTARTFPAYLTNGDLQPLLDGLSAYEGETLGERIETFLVTDVGVTAEELESIRAILLE